MMSRLQDNKNNRQNANARQFVILEPLEDSLRIFTMIKVARGMSGTALWSDNTFSMNLH